MIQVSTPIKIVMGIGGILIVSLLGLRLLNTGEETNYIEDITQDTLNLVESANNESKPGPVYYPVASPLGEYLRIRTGFGAAETQMLYYTRSSLTDTQQYVRNAHENETDAKKVIDLYTVIVPCGGASCGEAPRETENKEYQYTLRVPYDGFWYSGILVTHTHKTGVLVTGILEKGEVAVVTSTTLTSAP